jgi:hypothetical protein
MGSHETRKYRTEARIARCYMRSPWARKESGYSPVILKQVQGDDP